jgi:signal transduction histidine kinase
VAATAADRQLPLVKQMQDVVQQSVQDLRGLMTDLDRSDLRSGRLVLTVSALTEQLRVEGIDVELDLPELPDLGDEVTATLIGVLRETLVNAHASAAGHVHITLASTGRARAGELTRVLPVVGDDGVGLDGARVDRHKESNLRMQLLHDRVRSLQGGLVVTSGPGFGTTVWAVLPIGAGYQGTSRN